MLRLWSYDLAREQAPTLDHLRRLLSVTSEAGYTGIGLYLEHRFAYPSVHFANGTGTIGPDMVKTLASEFPQVQIVPFINVLGHFEGFIYTESGKHLAEARFKGMQACPSSTELATLACDLARDVIEAFDSELVHIGGDEAQQLGECPTCAAKVKSWVSEGRDGRARLYGEHVGRVAEYVLQKGRRPAIWGDMLLHHPEAAEFIPKETLVFDWQYFQGPSESLERLRRLGYEVVVCPTLHTYNAPWMHLHESEGNIAQHESELDQASGICLTTWEQGLMGNYETLIPAIKAFGSSKPLRHAYELESDQHGLWAQLMGVELSQCGGVFAFSQTRSSLKCRLLLYSNPFLLWLHHREELMGEMGDSALAVLERAIHVAPNAAYRGVSEFVQSAVQFVRYADQARQAYAQGLPGLAASSLAPCRQIFEHLEAVARATQARIGGSLADIERCRSARKHIETVMARLRDYGDGSLGYLPAFEILTHPKFVPHDQGNWWLINRWANE